MTESIHKVTDIAGAVAMRTTFQRRVDARTQQTDAHTGW